MNRAHLYLSISILAIGLVGCGKNSSSSNSESKSSESKSSGTTNSESSKSGSKESKANPEASHPNAAVEPPKQEAEKEFVIDVRSQKEWDTGHLENAVLIPHSEIAERIGEVTDDKSAKLVLY